MSANNSPSRMRRFHRAPLFDLFSPRWCSAASSDSRDDEKRLRENWHRPSALLFWKKPSSRLSYSSTRSHPGSKPKHHVISPLTLYRLNPAFIESSMSCCNKSIISPGSKQPLRRYDSCFVANSKAPRSHSRFTLRPAISSSRLTSETVLSSAKYRHLSPRLNPASIQGTTACICSA